MGDLKTNPRTFSILFMKSIGAKIHTINIISPWHVICGPTPSGYRESIWTCGKFSEAWICPPPLCAQLGTGNPLLSKHPIVYRPDSKPHLGSARRNSETEGQRRHRKLWLHQCVGGAAGKRDAVALLLSPTTCSDAQTFALPRDDQIEEVWKDSWGQEKVTACLF